MTKLRRHHNNKGKQQMKSGTYLERLKRLAKKPNIPFGKKSDTPTIESVIGK